MYFKFFYTASIFFFVSLITSCIGHVGTIPRYNPSLGGDYSFPATGVIIDTSNAASVIGHAWRRNRSSTPEAEILLSGQIRRRGSPRRHILASVRLEYQKDMPTIGLPNFQQQYTWEGTVSINNHIIPAGIRFEAWGTENGNHKHFFLLNAVLGQARLDFADPFEIFSDHASTGFPYLVGYVHLYNSTYRLYAVNGYSFNNRLLTRDIFFNPQQKFQFLDVNYTVVAELKQGKLTVYNTMPDAERLSLNNAVALLLAFRHSASVLRELRNSWEPSSFERFVYPDDIL